MALRTPQGRIQDAATKEMPGASVRSGNDVDGPAPPQPLAVAGLLLAAPDQKEDSSLRAVSRASEVQKVSHDARIHFSAAC
jgi:hypothetical protein